MSGFFREKGAEYYLQDLEEAYAVNDTLPQGLEGSVTDDDLPAVFDELFQDALPENLRPYGYIVGSKVLRWQDTRTGYTEHLQGRGLANTIQKQQRAITNHFFASRIQEGDRAVVEFFSAMDSVRMSRERKHGQKAHEVEGEPMAALFELERRTAVRGLLNLTDKMLNSTVAERVNEYESRFAYASPKNTENPKKLNVVLRRFFGSNSRVYDFHVFNPNDELSPYDIQRAKDAEMTVHARDIAMTIKEDFGGSMAYEEDRKGLNHSVGLLPAIELIRSILAVKIKKSPTVELDFENDRYTSVR